MEKPQILDKDNFDSDDEEETNKKSKKIIKRFVKKRQYNDKEEGLKNWQPKKIIKTNQKNDTDNNISKDIASKLLAGLSKPTNLTSDYQKYQFQNANLSSLSRKPNINLVLTEEQLFWDKQDQFIKKQFVKLEPEHKLSQNIEDNEELDLKEQVINVQTKDKKRIKVKEINLIGVIDEEWEKGERVKNLKQFWTKEAGIMEDRGIRTKYVKQAVDKCEQIEDNLNKRQMEKKKVKSRYGW